MQIQGDKIVTNSGACPLAGARMTFYDATRIQTKTSPTGIWLAVASVVLFGWMFGLGLLGLFFLFMKDTDVSGMITVTITNHEFFHVDYIQINSVAYHDQILAYLTSMQTVINR